MDLKEEEILAEKIRDHWYYISKGRAMRKCLGDIKTCQVLDIGAGSGIFSRQLLDEGLCDSAVCFDPNYHEERTEKHNGKIIHFVKEIKSASQDLILMMDVLEHVYNDFAFFEEHVCSMKTGGHVLITAPAFQFMWSGHDVFLSHYRRYTLSEIEDIAKRTGMKIVRSSYFFGSLFPAISAIRMIKNRLIGCGELSAKSELRPYPEWINNLLIMIHDMERHIFFKYNKFFGLSVFCLCKKV